MSDETPPNYRLLIIDDNLSIHDDFRKILGGGGSGGALVSMEAALFGGASSTPPAGRVPLRIDSAMQGEGGLALVRRARESGDPYALAFVDMRMPPGWDGLRTIREIWRVDPDLNIVICTAFSDHSWGEIEAIAGDGDHLLVLKKPFEPIEVRRMAATLTAKWTQDARAALKMSELEKLVRERTAELHAERDRCDLALQQAPA